MNLHLIYKNRLFFFVILTNALEHVTLFNIIKIRIMHILLLLLLLLDLHEFGNQ